MGNPFERPSEARQEGLALRPTAISIAAGEAYQPGSVNNLERQSFSSAYPLNNLQLYDSQAGGGAAALNPGSTLSNEGSALSPIQSGGDSSSSPAQSLLNLFAQQDQLLGSNPSDATNGVMNFMQQQDQLATSIFSNPNTAEQGIGTSNIQPIPEGANIQALTSGADIPAAPQGTPGVETALQTGLSNPLGALTQLGDSLGLPTPPSPESLTSALQTGMSDPLGGLTQLGDSLGLPTPPSPETLTSALQTGMSDPLGGLIQLGDSSGLPTPPNPATVANDLQTGLTNPLQGLTNLANDLNPFNLI